MDLKREEKMKTKCRAVWLFLFWAAFLGIMVVIVYTSFQNGEEYAGFGKHVIEKMASEYYGKEKLSYHEVDRFTYYARQILRMIAFFLLGITGTATIHITFRRAPWLMKTVISGCLFAIFAWITEKGKIYFPTRHYSYNQMMLSEISAILGVFLVSIMALLVSFIQDLHKKRNWGRNV